MEKEKFLAERFSKISAVKKIYAGLKNSGRIYISQLYGSSKALLVNKAVHEFDQIVLLFSSIKEAQEINVELNILGLDKQTVLIDDYSIENIQEKITDLSSRINFVLISTYELLAVQLPSKEKLDKYTSTIEPGSSITYNDLIDFLNVSNYQKQKYVENTGDYAVRGAIIDFWSYSEKLPCRLEFDGDFIESLRYFDIETQRSSFKANKVTLASQIDISGNGSDNCNLFQYLNDPVIIASEMELKELTGKYTKQIDETAEELDELESELREEIFESYSHVIKKSEESRFSKISITEDWLSAKDARWIIERELTAEDTVLLDVHPAPAINSNYNLLSDELQRFAANGFEVFLTSENEIQAKKLYSLLCDLNERLEVLLESSLIKIIVLPVKKGFYCKNEKLLVLTDYELFNKPYRSKISKKQLIKKSKARDLAALKIGDFVVHETFGIGQYSGLQTIKIGMTEQESIKILYAEGGVVYVNLHYLSLVKKYSSNEAAKPKLSALGSNEWRTTKRKVKSKIADAARELLKLYAQRKASKGIAFGPDTIWQKELEASFMYEDTPDQVKVNEEVKNDMESGNPMDRLICGDVGFGKTEIAVRAAFKAVNDGKQSALLVPTTILAEQHYNTFKDRLAQFPVKVEVLSRFSSPKEQKDVLKKLAEGKVDVIIGTHRLLSKDVKFNDLGLLIIDEEHRFGVMAKEKLKAFRANVDTLAMTATPIPRTLNLSLLGARDLSIIGTPPPNRQPIYTRVDRFDIAKIKSWILQEIRRDGQVYFVHDRVQSIEKIASYLQKYLPEIKFGIAHGQMRPSDLESVIHDFLNKKYHVLIATKIIESGIDIPNVNTIIINRADRFGLAELHQLRGRVGRSDRQAYAYLLVPSLNTITKNAVRRLQAIEEYTELGEGFNISMRDLEIRGTGNLLGTEQSGAIDSVGFDMYVKLLDEAVEELKLSEFKEEFKDLPKHREKSEPTIDTFFEIGIPKNYMPEQGDRLSFYTSLFSIINIEEIDEIRDEIRDRFGKEPVIVNRLILSAVLRFNASFALFEKIIIKKEKSVIILPRGDREDFYKDKFSKLLNHIYQHYSKDIKFIQAKETLKLEIKHSWQSPEEILAQLNKFCLESAKLIAEEL